VDRASLAQWTPGCERIGGVDGGITTRTYLHGSVESDRAAASTLDVIFDAAL